uniref:Uncharacterized protein n=1 Tax=Scleropages formosus TaxID=113540 RepID=A0A8C9VZX7_SCLFO
SMYRRGVFNCDYSLFHPAHFCKITKDKVILEDLLSNFELNQAVISGMVTVYILSPLVAHICFHGKLLPLYHTFVSVVLLKSTT